MSFLSKAFANLMLNCRWRSLPLVIKLKFQESFVSSSCGILVRILHLVMCSRNHEGHVGGYLFGRSNALCEIISTT